jgi:hypothetical protein
VAELIGIRIHDLTKAKAASFGAYETPQAGISKKPTDLVLNRLDIRSAFACEVILGAPVRDLFNPLFAEMKRVVSDRARARLELLQPLAGDARHASRLTHLCKIAEQPPTLFDV